MHEAEQESSTGKSQLLNRLCHIPLRGLVILLLALSLATGGILLSIILVQSEKEDIYQRYSEDMESDASVILNQLTQDGALENSQASQRLLDLYSVHSDVEQIIVVSKEGTVQLASQSRLVGSSFAKWLSANSLDHLSSSEFIGSQPQAFIRNFPSGLLTGAFTLPVLGHGEFSGSTLWIWMDLSTSLRSMWQRLALELFALVSISLICIVLIYRLLSRQLLSPLERLIDFTHRITEDGLGEQISDLRGFELRDLGNSINTLSRQLKDNLDEADLKNRALEQIISVLEQNQEDLRVAACAFETEEAILITDADTRILKVNSAFTVISGYDAEEVIGKTPNMFASGRHDKAFYKKMWDDLKLRGVWRGEIWNKKKDGTIFPEMETITAVTDIDGQVTHYVACFSDITERKAAEKKVNQMAFYDELTGLPNRRLFRESLIRSLSFSSRMNQCGAVIFIDLDHFKEVNDSMGHFAGDELLKLAAQRLKRYLRLEDVLARFGGDEFVLLANGLGIDREEAMVHGNDLALRMLKDLCEPFSLFGKTVHISGSIGIAIFPDDAEDAESLLKKADTAMYHSKEKGRKSVHFFSDDMQSLVDERFQVRQNLRDAINSDELSLHLQPQICMESGKIEGAECLLRWVHPEDGFISPALFIPVAEDSDLIIELDKWVLRRACEEMKLLESKGIFLPRLSINVSAKHFHHNAFISRVKEAIEETGCDFKRICIEVTEGAFIGEMDAAISRMNQLRDLGLEIAVDDFGTGYSSLSYLEKMPITELKIDKSFVDKVPLDRRGSAVAGTVIALGHELDFRIVAEGVESETQLEFLKKRGCDICQGYFFSRPLSIDDFEKFWKQTGNCVVLNHGNNSA